MKNKNLFATIIATLLISFVNQLVKAQIIYTDIPDITLSTAGAVYPLDLNNDGVVDFNLSISGKAYKSQRCGMITVLTANISTFGKNQVLTTQSVNIYYPMALDFNSSIDASTSTWKDGKSLPLNSHNNVTCDYEFSSEFGGCSCYSWHVSNEGQWNYVADKFLGLKIKSDGKDYYGWVRLSSWPLTIKDFAINATPSQAIYAGQSTTEYVVLPSINLNGCIGGNINIPYITTGNFSNSNIFSTELSDINGSFSNPIVIGTLNSTTSGTINATVPANVSEDYSRKVRVSSTTPARISNEYTITFASFVPNIQIYPENGSGDTALVTCWGGYLHVYSTNGSMYGGIIQWKKNGIDIPGANEWEYLPLLNGDYTCSLTNGCGTAVSNILHAIVDCKINGKTGQNNNEATPVSDIQNSENKFNVKIFPNPVSNSATIAFTIPQPGKISVKLFDINGRLLRTIANKFFEAGKQQIQWNTQGVLSGVYILKMESEKYSATQKISVLK